MEKEFVPYELAVKLKALGFSNSYSIGGYQGGAVFYYEEGKLYYDGRPMYSSDSHAGQIDAPLYQQAFRWFREKYRLNGLLNHYPNTKEWDCSVHNLEWSGKELMEYIKTEDRSLRYPKHEEAELACLEKLIEIVESKSE